MSVSLDRTVFTEISRLHLTIEEKTALRSFFSNCNDKREVAQEVLKDCPTDDEKVAYLKTFLTP
ncbi:8670_t:CDS:1, partial [Paraglomus occultum]